METASMILVLCEGNPPMTGLFPSNKDQWRVPLVFSLIHAWTNNRDAGDLRRNSAHYDVTVMRRTRYNHTMAKHNKTVRTFIFGEQISESCKMFFCHDFIVIWVTISTISQWLAVRILTQYCRDECYVSIQRFCSVWLRRVNSSTWIRFFCRIPDLFW